MVFSKQRYRFRVEILKYHDDTDWDSWNVAVVVSEKTVYCLPLSYLQCLHRIVLQVCLTISLQVSDLTLRITLRLCIQ